MEWIDPPPLGASICVVEDQERVGLIGPKTLSVLGVPLGRHSTPSLTNFMLMEQRRGTERGVPNLLKSGISQVRLEMGHFSLMPNEH